MTPSKTTSKAGSIAIRLGAQPSAADRDTKSGRLTSSKTAENKVSLCETRMSVSWWWQTATTCGAITQRIGRLESGECSIEHGAFK